MPRDNKQKIKLLYLMEILRQDTDEQHPISTNQICKRLSEQGISCERRTVGMDMKVLNDYGYEIMSKMVGHEKAYYIDDRSFSVPEIKILMDAVQAAKFITPGKSAALIEKLAALGGSHQAEILTGNIVCFDTRKHTNEMIFYNVQALEDAIREHKKASFLYFDLNENKEKVYRRDGERYTVDPMALVYNEDFYYLMCFNSKYEAITTYRVDRIENGRITDRSIETEDRSDDYHLQQSGSPMAPSGSSPPVCSRPLASPERTWFRLKSGGRPCRPRGSSANTGCGIWRGTRRTRSPRR